MGKMNFSIALALMECKIPVLSFCIDRMWPHTTISQ